MKSLMLGVLAAVSLVGAAQAAPVRAPAEPQASIPFVNHGAIRNWQAPDSQTLYLQDNHNRWYRAEMFGPCMNLPYAVGIRFETRGTDRLDRFSTVRVGRDRCQIASLTPSEAPAKIRHGKS